MDVIKTHGKNELAKIDHRNSTERLHVVLSWKFPLSHT